MPRPNKSNNPYRYFDSSPEVVRLVVIMYVKYPLSLRNVEDLLFERGIDFCHETVRLWWNRFGKPWSVVTDGLRSYGAALKEIGNDARQEIGRWINNQAENSHQPFRRRERAMERFRQMKATQKFAAMHGTVLNLFNKESPLISRDIYRERRSTALAEWRAVMA